MVSDDQLAFFRKNGHLIVRDILSEAEIKDLQKWAQEVHDWTPTTDSDFMPYKEVNARGEGALCRTENYVDSHDGFNNLLRGEKLLGLLGELSGEPMLLFKEKINYKLAGSGRLFQVTDFERSIDQRNRWFCTAHRRLDNSNMKNGGLEVVDASHEMDIPINPEDRCIEPSWVASHEWKPVELEPGQLLIFTSYLAHRSGANNSNQDRKAIYATYNLAREGDMHRKYYEDRRREWPATHMRKKGESYSKGALTYGFGSPMLSVDAGRQLAF